MAELHRVNTDEADDAPSVPNTTLTFVLLAAHTWVCVGCLRGCCSQRTWVCRVFDGLMHKDSLSHCRLDKTVLAYSVWASCTQHNTHLVLPVSPLTSSTSTLGSGWRPDGLLRGQGLRVVCGGSAGEYTPCLSKARPGGVGAAWFAE